LIERLIENWLTRANERSFQVPYCHWLAYSGHTVVHLSRHCAMEMGKDILSIDRDGTPCAYQLKGVDGAGKLSLSSWRADLERQIHSLVLGRIVHPSIPGDRPHRAYIVINGEIDETVSRAIDDFNQGLAQRGDQRKLHVVVRGDLFRRFKDLEADFWPANPGDMKTFLELYLENGQGQLPKAKMATLFESTLPFDSDASKGPGRAEAARAVAACAILCATSISAFTNARNHLAEFEAWTMYSAYVLALAEKWNFSDDYFQFAIDVAHEAIYSALGRLCDELVTRTNFTEGNILTDSQVFKARITHLLGLMGIYGLWKARRLRTGIEINEDCQHQFLRDFSLGKSKLCWLWGEYAIPQFLANNFFRRTFDPSPGTDLLYGSLLQAIVKLNGEGKGSLPNPYYDAETFLPHLLGLEHEELNDSFHRSSYYLEGLLHLFIRANFKQQLRWMFPSITKLGMRHYVPSAPWRYYFWRDRSGKNHHRFLQPPHSWSALKKLAADDAGDDLPPLLKRDPIACLCFLLVYPHRVSASGLRWLSSRLADGA
jgi:hypothetical protein